MPPVVFDLKNSYHNKYFLCLTRKFARVCLKRKYIWYFWNETGEITFSLLHLYNNSQVVTGVQKFFNKIRFKHRKQWCKRQSSTKNLFLLMTRYFFVGEVAFIRCNPCLTGVLRDTWNSYVSNPIMSIYSTNIKPQFLYWSLVCSVGISKYIWYEILYQFCILIIVVLDIYQVSI